MASFGKNSLKQRELLCVEGQEIVDEVIKIYDFGLFETHRPKSKHEEYLKSGATTVPYSRTYHRHKPSHAWDAYPYHQQTKMYLTGHKDNIIAFRNKAKTANGKKLTYAEARHYILGELTYLAGLFMATAHAQGKVATSGRDFDRDTNTLDQTFIDLPHTQLEGIKAKAQVKKADKK